MKPLIVGVTGLAAGLGLHCHPMSRLPELYRLKWLCDLDAEKTRRGVADYGGQGTQSLDEVLADPEVDLVTLATPVATHAALAQRALASGKHVLVEKPVAASVAEADALVSAAKTARGVLCVGHQRRFSSNQRAVEAVLASGELGQVVSVHLDISVMDATGGVPSVDPSTWTERFTRSHGYDYLVHHVDQICRLFREWPRQIQGRMATLAGRDLPCAMQMAMTMPSGVLASVDLRYSHAPDFKWQIDGEKASLRMAMANDMGACQIYRRLPDGSRQVRDLQRPVLRRTVDSETGDWRTKTSSEMQQATDLDAHLEFYRHLFVAIVRSGPVPAPVEDARNAVRMIWLAVESARTGRTVNWE